MTNIIITCKLIKVMAIETVIYDLKLKQGENSINTNSYEVFRNFKAYPVK